MTVVSDYTAILASSLSSTPGKAAFYTYSFASTPPAYLYGLYSPDQLATFRPLTNQEKASARAALDAWASISGLTLFEVTQSVGDINFGAFGTTNLAELGAPTAAGFAYFGQPDSRDGITSDVFLASNYAGETHLLLHEIGHALGLKHPFDGSVTLAPSLDNFSQTVMSYTPGGSSGAVLGPLDIAAIQYLYGTNSNDGSEVASWSWNATTETLTQTGGPGDDVIAGVSSRDIISGGAGADSIIGGSGGSGGDMIDGGDGADTLTGVDAIGYGATSIAGGAGNDSITLTIDAANPGAALDGDAGDDAITVAVDVSNPVFSVDGGAGADRLSIYAGYFGSSQAPLNLTLSGDGKSGGLVTNVETISVSGTTQADSIIGSADADSVSGAGGADTIQAMGGNDTIFDRVDSTGAALAIDGGEGADYVSLELTDPAPSHLDNLVLNGGAGNDTLSFTYFGNQSLTFSLAASLAGGSNITGFESINLAGAGGDDRLTGSALNEAIQGQDGNDTITGGLGQDTLYGGAGADRFVYATAADSPQAGPDTIGDFTSGVDVADLTAFPVWNLAVNGSQVSGIALTGNVQINVFGTVGLADIAHQTVGVYKMGTPGADGLTGQAGIDNLNGAGGDDQLSGLAGNDFLTGGAGNDTLDGGAGNDIAIDSIAHTAATVTRNPVSRALTVNAGADDVDTLTHVEQLQFSDGLFSYQFGQPSGVLVANFAVGAGGWSSQTAYPRHIADVNGDGYADIVGFGQAGVLVSFGSASGTFSSLSLAVANFGQVSGWSSDDLYHRELADVNGDGRADVIGFGQAGTLVSLAKADGTFNVPVFALANFGAAQGWSSQDSYARAVGDINGDGKADLIGFGQAGTLVALGNGDGTFQPVKVAVANFGVAQGWSSDTSFHRAVADVNGDGKADIIGFGVAGTYVALSNGDGTFGDANLVLNNFGANQGWTSNDLYPRLVADVNHDGFADIIGFGAAGTFVAFGNGDGSFTGAGFDVANFSQAQGWSSDATYHRELADINHDGLVDVVGFGQAGVLVGLNQGDIVVATPSAQAALSPATDSGTTPTTVPPSTALAFTQAMAGLGTGGLAASWVAARPVGLGDDSGALARPT